jgi:hypothetical protein
MDDGQITINPYELPLINNEVFMNGEDKLIYTPEELTENTSYMAKHSRDANTKITVAKFKLTRDEISKLRLPIGTYKNIDDLFTQNQALPSINYMDNTLEIKDRKIAYFNGKFWVISKKMAIQIFIFVPTTLIPSSISSWFSFSSKKEPKPSLLKSSSEKALATTPSPLPVIKRSSSSSFGGKSRKTKRKNPKSRKTKHRKQKRSNRGQKTRKH